MEHLRDHENVRENELEAATSRLLRRIGSDRNVMVAARAWEEWISSSEDLKTRKEVEGALFDALAAAAVF